ncbi:MAG: PilZ domain-containing protein [Planctomycetota bacterium]|nr:PilZ domain-containing protein [Planctomycetota bacterium]
MAQGAGHERRVHERVDREVPVYYKFRHLDPRRRPEKLTYQGVSKNFSRGGLSLVGPLPEAGWISSLLMSKILLDLEIEWPGGRKFKAACRAAWVEARPGGEGQAMFGLTFTDLAPELRQDLERFMQEGT